MLYIAWIFERRKVTTHAIKINSLTFVQFDYTLYCFAVFVLLFYPLTVSFLLYCSCRYSCCVFGCFMQLLYLTYTFISRRGQEYTYTLSHMCIDIQRYKITHSSLTKSHTYAAIHPICFKLLRRLFNLSLRVHPLYF